MEFISMENWQIARDIIALMICFVALSCLIRSKSGFHRVFLRKMKSDYHQQMIKELSRLRKHNAEYKKMMKQVMNPENIGFAGSARRNPKGLKKSHSVKPVYPRKKAASPVSLRPEAKKRLPAGSVDQKVRMLYEKKPMEIQSHEDSIIPRAELEFKQKFDRLAGLKNAKARPAEKRGYAR
jgi:hypothetical protein